MTDKMTTLGDTKMSVTMKDMLLDDLKDAQEGISFRPPRYTVDHKSLEFYNVDNMKIRKDTVEGVIVINQKIRGLWEEGQKLPLCSSLNGKTGTFKAADVVETRPCESCPMNAWGSGKGGNGKACKEMRRVMLVEKTDDLYPVVLTIPPTSLKIFDGFISTMIHEKKPPIMFNVKFALETAESGGFKFAKIKMSLGDALSESQILKMAAIKNQFKAHLEQTGVEEELIDRTKDEGENLKF